MRQLLILILMLTVVSYSCAQFHYKGLKGAFGEVGIHTNFDKLYGVGYQFYLDRRFQVEITTEYESGYYQDRIEYSYYDVDASYHIKNFYLNETLNYNFLTVFKRIFLNVGIGFTQSYQRILTVDSLAYVTNPGRLKEANEIEGFDWAVLSEKSMFLEDNLCFGGNINALIEVFINRYITLTVRHRLKYFLKSNYTNPIQHSSIGLRINF